jgi:hypothetical protein
MDWSDKKMLEKFYRWTEIGDLDEDFTRIIMETLSEMRQSRLQKSV